MIIKKKVASQVVRIMNSELVRLVVSELINEKLIKDLSPVQKVFVKVGSFVVVSVVSDVTSDYLIRKFKLEEKQTEENNPS